MVRKFMVEDDGSEDIGATPEVSGCPRCNGEGRVEKREFKKMTKEDCLKILKEKNII